MKTNNEIEHIANNVLTKYVKSGGVYKVFNDIMSSEKIKFREIPSVSDKFVGALTKGNNDQVYIIINKNIDNIGRKHFTIAHELGHYFLQHQLHQNSIFCNNNDILEQGHQSNPIEREANYFASCLLMPEEKVRNTFLKILENRSRKKIKDFLIVRNDASYGIWCGIRDELTKRYGVSEAALRYRLQQLMLAKFEFE
mgnify:CR=1 FL=1